MAIARALCAKTDTNSMSPLQGIAGSTQIKKWVISGPIHPNELHNLAVAQAESQCRKSG
jgi:hypothetical protein